MFQKRSQRSNASILTQPLAHFSFKSLPILCFTMVRLRLPINIVSTNKDSFHSQLLLYENIFYGTFCTLYGILITNWHELLILSGRCQSTKTFKQLGVNILKFRFTTKIHLTTLNNIFTPYTVLAY